MASDGSELIVVCRPDDGSVGSVLFSCGNVEGVPYNAYAIERYVLTKEQHQTLLAVAEPFDVAVGAQFFSFGFSVVVGSWLTAFFIGVVLQKIRSV